MPAKSMRATLAASTPMSCEPPTRRAGTRVATGASANTMRNATLVPEASRATSTGYDPAGTRRSSGARSCLCRSPKSCAASSPVVETDPRCSTVKRSPKRAVVPCASCPSAAGAEVESSTAAESRTTSAGASTGVRGPARVWTIRSMRHPSSHAARRYVWWCSVLMSGRVVTTSPRVRRTSTWTMLSASGSCDGLPVRAVPRNRCVHRARSDGLRAGQLAVPGREVRHRLGLCPRLWIEVDGRSAEGVERRHGDAARAQPRGVEVRNERLDARSCQVRGHTANAMTNVCRGVPNEATG